MDATTGTFLATEVDDDTAVLRDVDSGQVLTLGEPPEPPLERLEVLRGTVAPQPPTEVVWTVESVDRRWTVDLVESDLTPTKQARELADGIAPGELVTRERAGDGEIHVLGVDDPETAVADVLGDEETVARAARLGAVRVEVRAGADFLNVRYLPD
jgi:hypothetical protein